MAISDNKSEQKVNLLHNAVIATDTTTNTSSINTADFDMGVMLSMSVTAFTDGTYVLSLEDSPDNSTFTAVASIKLIGTAPTVSALTSASAGLIATLGVISTEKWIRGVITSTGTTSGATVNVQSILMGEYNPQ